MLAPTTRIAFSMVENPGVYALLLGSGLSRAASIPTGWDITLDLIRRLAAAEGVEGRRDWREWHIDRFGTEPSYSVLLDTLSVTPAERRSILHHYIEPTTEDLDHGRRTPTKAHKAIARLVKAGFVRVVVTTNFDRLLEQALSAMGVEPIVVRSVDDLRGASPLAHSRCFILKVHGDYLDNRILNTEEELAGYPAEFDRLLDRIVDEYGLIVSGWSGDWDPALRAAIKRAHSRRYPMWWATRGEPSTAAKELIAARSGALVTVEDADSFFHDLADAVTTLESARRPDPDTMELLVATTKRNLASPERRIELADGFATEVDRLLGRISGPEFPVQVPPPTNEAVLDRWRAMEGLAEPLARMLALAGRWGDGSDLKIAQDAVQTIAAARADSGSTALIALASYPAYLCTLTYSLGLSKAERWSHLRTWLETEITSEFRKPQKLVNRMFMQAWTDMRGEMWKLWPDLEERLTPWADHLVAAVVPWTRDLGMAAGTAVTNYHLVELLGGLVALADHDTDELSSRTQAMWVPHGQTMWLRERRENLFETVGLIRNKEALLAAGFCRGSAMHWDASIKALEVLAAKVSW